MVRVLFALALCVATVSAFVAPANHAVASSAYASSTSAKMIPVEVVDVAASNIAQNANLVATAAGDFGGYAYPVVGIGFLAAFILYLSPPLADE
mmetsp:Transcript_21378/g.40620  ORF Transcript_21378/g.40620 Transcript_21378/m.40620 type:complete len:94 (-) Transcript_21378:104-385(-)